MNLFLGISDLELFILALAQLELIIIFMPVFESNFNY